MVQFLYKWLIEEAIGVASKKKKKAGRPIYLGGVHHIAAPKMGFPSLSIG